MIYVFDNEPDPLWLGRLRGMFRTPTLPILQEQSLPLQIEFIFFFWQS